MEELKIKADSLLKQSIEKYRQHAVEEFKLQNVDQIDKGLLKETQNRVKDLHNELLEINQRLSNSQEKQKQKEQEILNLSQINHEYLQTIQNLNRQQGELNQENRFLKAKEIEWVKEKEKDKKEQKEQGHSAAVIGKKYEDETIDFLKRSLASFAIIESCSTETSQMDIDVFIRSFPCRIRIDTKNFKTTLPMKDYTKFFSDIDKMKTTDIDTCILFSSGPLVGLKEGTYQRSERSGLGVYLIGRGSFDLLLEAIFDTIVRKKIKDEVKEQLKLEQEKKEEEIKERLKLFVPDTLNSFCKKSVRYIHDMMNCWQNWSEELKSNEGKFSSLLRDLIESARTAHADCPNSLDTMLLNLLEKSLKSKKGRPNKKHKLDDEGEQDGKKKSVKRKKKS